MVDLDRTSEEISREGYILSLKLHLNTQLGPQLRKTYENLVLPRFLKRYERHPQNRHEIRKEMVKESSFQIWGALWCVGQELMWDGIGDEVYRQIYELNSRYQVAQPKGSLRIINNFVAPHYVTDLHIHGQPGGYELSFSNDDVTAGILCEGAHRLYSRGQGAKTGGFRVMDVLAEDIKQAYQPFRPRRILDIGCNIGRTTVAIKNAFPNAEVYGIDIGPGIVRYAHARAENMGYGIHFALQNAEKTDYPDMFFDLILSGTLLHETSFKAIYKIFSECYRLLSLGGIMAHLEIGLRTRDMQDDLYQQWYRDWSTHFNAEPFWGKFHDMDVIDPILKAGFSKSESWERYIPLNQGGNWWACGGRKIGNEKHS